LETHTAPAWRLVASYLNSAGLYRYLFRLRVK
jgi:hypothetical protein